MSTLEVEKKPYVAIILSLIGGIDLLALGAQSVAIYIDHALRGQYDLGYLFGVLVPLWVIGFLIPICGILSVYSAVRVNLNPWKHETWGTGILLSSTVGIFLAYPSFTVFALVGLIGVIGGILVLMYKPRGCLLP